MRHLAILTAAALIAAVPAAAKPGLATSDLNLRAGPGTGHAVIATIPRGGAVDVEGCLSDLAWCEVAWNGRRGWASARYLALEGTGGGTTILRSGRSSALPVVRYDPTDRAGEPDRYRWETRTNRRQDRLATGEFGRHETPAPTYRPPAPVRIEPVEPRRAPGGANRLYPYPGYGARRGLY
ncbi:SH3 domain-containing protein [Lutibaculum baratangense]|uniref:SH3b domain-containing protein n=1 Tax=Lutibaculum baratangense AMV1 TaxID=631454 RepID=V4RL30_9HYPH|nr:SH3 domain-containing protein [Lutibaculum baratangense]ESR26009.1 hypothetical protein N177_1344 [Lutibaculum baratangense AMV1]